MECHTIGILGDYGHLHKEIYTLSSETLFGLEKISSLGVVPAPTVLTPFVRKQMDIPFMFDLDELINLHTEFNGIIDSYNLPVFSGVFSLA